MGGVRSLRREVVEHLESAVKASEVPWEEVSGILTHAGLFLHLLGF